MFLSNFVTSFNVMLSLFYENLQVYWLGISGWWMFFDIGQSSQAELQPANVGLKAFSFSDCLVLKPKNAIWGHRSK